MLKTTINKKTALTKEELINSYNNLNDLEKAILALKYLAFCFISKDLLKIYLDRAGYKETKSKSLTPTYLNNHVQNLTDMTLLEPVNSHIIENPIYLSFFTDEASKLKDYDTLLSLASEHIKEKLLHAGPYYHNSLPPYETIVFSGMRLAFITNNEPGFKKYHELLTASRNPTIVYDHINTAFTLPNFTIENLKSKSLFLQNYVLSNKIFNLLNTGVPSEDYPILENYYKNLFNREPALSNAYYFYQYSLLLQGKLSEVETLLSQDLSLSAWQKQTVLASIAFFKGQNDLAIALYQEALKLLKQAVKTTKPLLPDLHGFFFLLALIKSNQPTHKSFFEKYIDIFGRGSMAHRAFGLLAKLFYNVSQGNKQMIEKIHDDLEAIEDNLPYDSIFTTYKILVDYLCKQPEHCDTKFQNFLLNCATKPSISYFAELSKIFIQIAHKCSPSNKTANLLEILPIETQIDYANFLDTKNIWKNLLDSIENLLGHNNQEKNKRLIWRIGLKDQIIDSAEQTITKNGNWSSGRSIAKKRFTENDPTLNYLTDQDNRVIEKALKYSSRPGYSYDHSFDFPIAIHALIGHPNIYDIQTEQRLELIEDKPELIINEKNNKIHIQFSKKSDKAKVFLTEESKNRYRVALFTEKHLELQNLLSPEGISIPLEAKAQLSSLIQKANSMMHVNCSIDGIGLPKIEANPIPHVQLIPHATGFSVSLIVRPTEKLETRYRPGHGKFSTTNHIDGQYFIITRDLNQESNLAKELIHSSAILANEDTGADQWFFDLETSLEFLLELQSREIPVNIEWPQGEKLSVSKPIHLKSLHLNIKSQSEWFQLEGKITVDQDKILEMSQIIKALSNSKSRFIRLDDGSFLTLTNELKNEIEKISRITDRGDKVHPLRMHALMGLENESVKMHGDTHWKNFVNKIRNALKHSADIPSLLQADLRDYQVTGFRWLFQLSQMNSGACLADDMGLGKTIQTIALFLTKAENGPCLVVAPTSVCHIWVCEINTFAPSLTPHLFSESQEKQDIVNKMSKMDVLICSYGLLQRSAELFENKEWEVIVLDEAQAIKNPSTQRTQSTHKLKGKFKIALTGTPIENHLTELWSLFNFINPGLLGGLKSFQENFANPIQRDQSPSARKALRDLVLPFTLRRTKSQVLTDLPPRTETNLIVELSQEEEAFYEAMRQKSIENISSISKQESGQRKFAILAEITKLRRACCHPSLIDPSIAIPSSKVNLFKEIVQNLLDNHHKALVFSQYVGFLDIIRKELDPIGVSYQYLDGSTPANVRQQRVEAFQLGKGDLFLISLKAGGLGLNLTAADYVFLLDPWWNPAVENQASDRAYRIGQQRPVTIYRFISKNTIEEKIIKLHKTKQDLASEVLLGAEFSHLLTEQDLIEMIGSNVS